MPDELEPVEVDSADELYEALETGASEEAAWSSLRPESVTDAVVVARQRRRRARRRHRADPAPPRPHRRRGDARRAAARGAERRRRDDDRRRNDARRARGRSRDPRGAARGVPPVGVAATPRGRHDRREPAAGDPLLVLAPQVSVPAPRRRPLPRARGRAPRARDLRERLLRVGASVRSGRRAARARHDRPHGPARAAARGSCTGCRRRTTARRPRSRRTS